MSTQTQSSYKSYVIILHEFNDGDFQARVENPRTKKEVYYSDYTHDQHEAMKDAKEYIDGSNAYRAMRR